MYQLFGEICCLHFLPKAGYSETVVHTYRKVLNTIFQQKAGIMFTAVRIYN
jgi:hypothetical protein